MKWIFKKPASQKPKSKFIEWRDSLVFAVTVATLFRWSLVEAFVIPTPSMENSLLVGDYLAVSKFHFGARTPRTPLQLPLTHQKIWGTEIPSYVDWIQLPSFRLPGLREVKRGEPVVFNTPKDLLDPTDRPIDLKTYLVKRCVAIHGDKLEIRNRQLFVNGIASANPEGEKFAYLVFANDEINNRQLRNFELDSDDYSFLGRSDDGSAVYNMFLTADQASQLKSVPFVRSINLNDHLHDNSSFPIFPSIKASTWDNNNYGTLVIPEHGMEMIVNDSTLNVYGEIIQKYEGHKDVKIENESLLINGKKVSEYTFQQNYYFMMGDSRDNSLDSRYWGFVPEDHIVGKPLFVWMSISSEADLLHKIRWNRLFKSVE
ncbi:MAG TPA: signal peptidase I [Cytophagales bacterium]|jgi:signal peptidase I|nr:signal peptidase I [Cytophagales bacterium]